MAFQLSPGVNVTEKDLTTIVPAVATTNAAFSGPFAWGPINKVVVIDSENALVSNFGLPDDTNYDSWFSAANFLKYGNNLRVVRSVKSSSSAKNAVPTSKTAELTEHLLLVTQDRLEIHSPFLRVEVVRVLDQSILMDGNLKMSSMAVQELVYMYRI
jgi:hypothetical protein